MSGWFKMMLVFLAFALVATGIQYLPSYVQQNGLFPAAIVLIGGSGLYALIKA
jgi:hypothetical protein